ncbi:MAG TPA: HlyD family efflux transporter periplasmic adaptor subunit [Rhodoplanes sp.]|nr:HlyD family efflux transporter periplasmic adaptor subunit [Rhodoplanes sp.]
MAQRRRRLCAPIRGHSMSFRLRPPGLLSIIRLAAISCLAAACIGRPAALAHEGHDHDDAATTALAASTYPRVVAQSELYEIVGVRKKDRLTIYLDQLSSNEPVAGAKLRVTVGDGEPIDAEASESGVYTLPLPRLNGADAIEVVFSINASGGDDLLVGTLTPPTDSGAPPVSASLARRLAWVAAVPSPIRNPIVLSLFVFALGVLFSQLRCRRLFVPAMAAGAATVVPFGLLVAVALSDETQRSGYTAAQPPGPMSDAPRRLPDGTAFIAKAFSAASRCPYRRSHIGNRNAGSQPDRTRDRRSEPDQHRAERARRSRDAARRRAAAHRTGRPKGEALVQIDPYIPLADRTTIAEKIREIEQLIALAEIRIRRLRPLAERGAVPQSQVLDLETELEGLRLRRETIRNTRNELELLRAPTDGVIVSAKAAPGQVVQPQDILFQIVDPNGFWVEALAYGDLDPQSLAEATAVTASGQTMSLSYQGFSRALQQHASIVQFAIPTPPANLSLGQPVTVMAKTGAPVAGLIVKRDAVVRGANGEAMVWLHAAPERFEARPVRTQPFDATRLVVAGGVTDGERVVVRGADLINQIR